MAHRIDVPGHPWALWAALALAVVATVASCTYDFEAAFSGTPAGTGTASATGTESGGGTATGLVGGGGTGGVPTGGSAGTAGTGQGGTTGGENCGNGTDDDGDQLYDCADPDCQVGWECAVLPGPPWSEPVGVYRGDEALPVPDCSAPYTTSSDYGIGLSASPVSCTACDCDGTDLCSVADTEIFGGTGCAGYMATFAPSGIGVCEGFAVDDFDSAGSYDSNVAMTACTPGGGDVSSTPTVEWQEAVRICEGAWSQGADGGCANDSQACVPLPSTDLRRCVTRGGDVTCPSPYLQKTLVYTSVNDQRACTSCTCSGPVNIDCSNAQTLFFQSNDCSGSPAAVVPNDDSCNYVGENEFNDGSARFEVYPDYDGCNPSGGHPTGTVTGADPITVCCLPMG